MTKPVVWFATEKVTFHRVESFIVALQLVPESHSVGEPGDLASTLTSTLGLAVQLLGSLCPEPNEYVWFTSAWWTTIETLLHEGPNWFPDEYWGGSAQGGCGPGGGGPNKHGGTATPFEVIVADGFTTLPSTRTW